MWPDPETRFRALALTGGSRRRFIGNLLLNLRELREGQTRLRSQPLALSFAASFRCNLRCRMCNDLEAQFQPAAITRPGYYAEVRGALPYLKQLQTICGEPLAVPEVRELIEQFDRGRHPFLEFGMITNGTLLDEHWAEQVVRKLRWLNLSFNAATAATYEWQHRGARFATLVENCRRVVAWKHRLRDYTLYECGMFTVTAANFRELPAFLRLAAELDLRAVLLQPMRGDGDLHPDRTRDRLGSRVRSLNLFEHPAEYAPDLREMKGVLDEVFALLQRNPRHPDPVLLKPPRNPFNTDNLVTVIQLPLIVGKLNLALRAIGEEEYRPPAGPDLAPDAYRRLDLGWPDAISRRCADAFDVKEFYRQETARLGLPCLDPWQRLEIGYSGTASPCCEMFFAESSGGFGNVNERTLAEIWNGDAMVALRRAILDGTMQRICRRECPVFGRRAPAAAAR